MDLSLVLFNMLSRSNRITRWYYRMALRPDTIYSEKTEGIEIHVIKKRNRLGNLNQNQSCNNVSIPPESPTWREHNSKWLTDNLLQEGIYGLNYTTGCNNVFVIIPFTKSIHQYWVSQILLVVVESQTYKTVAKTKNDTITLTLTLTWWSHFKNALWGRTPE